MTVSTIVPNPPTADTWAPFGWLPVADTDPVDGTHALEFAWADAHVNRITHRRDEVPMIEGGLRCQHLFRHLTHTQVLMPLDAAAVLVVAPATSTMTTLDEVAASRAFLLQPLVAIVLHRGTWHWGPYPVEGDTVELFNVQGRRYREDNDRVDLEPIGASLDVLIRQ
jgi:ureidoglycolate hydrolase